MYLHPDTILALHEERRHRLEAEAARHALIRALRRRRRWRWRRPARPPAFICDTRPSQMNAETA
ncbi:MAG TPA: hypothetical protein VJ456_11530 [Acidimicrobiia bacterium]|nr:hypothetical protein [Acidimicrobiia bacterium]